MAGIGETELVQVPITDTTNFAYYGTGISSELWITANRYVVTLGGAITCNTADYLRTTTPREFAILPVEYRPAQNVQARFNGSNYEAWSLRVTSGGECDAYRYSASHTAGIWLPLTATWPRVL